ncbi:MAG TPA: acyltransferase family protein [Patescibacteria group bacterium]
MSLTPLRTHFLWVDLLRSIAILGVVTVHVTSPYLLNWEMPLSDQWLIANLIDSFGRMGVPLFFLLSGYLLLGTNRTKDVDSFYLRRWQKIGWLWLGWGFLHVWYLYFNHRQGWQWSVLITGFWFVPQILTVYFLTPFIEKWLENQRLVHAWMWVLLLFLAGSLLVQGAVWTYHEPYLPYLHLLPYVGLFIAGALVRNTKRRIHFYYLVSVWTFCYLVTVIGTTLTSSFRQGFNSLFYEYASLNVIGMSLTFFMMISHQEALFISWKKEWPGVVKIATYIGKNSYHLFLSHTLVLLLLTDYWASWSGGFSSVVPIDVVIKVVLVVGLSSVVIEVQKYLVRRVRVW